MVPAPSTGSISLKGGLRRSNQIGMYRPLTTGRLWSLPIQRRSSVPRGAMMWKGSQAQRSARYCRLIVGGARYALHDLCGSGPRASISWNVSKMGLVGLPIGRLHSTRRRSIGPSFLSRTGFGRTTVVLMVSSGPMCPLQRRRIRLCRFTINCALICPSRDSTGESRLWCSSHVRKYTCRCPDPSLATACRLEATM